MGKTQYKGEDRFIEESGYSGESGYIGERLCSSQSTGWLEIALLILRIGVFGSLSACSPSPAKIILDSPKMVLDGLGTTTKIVPRVVDQEGRTVKEAELVFFTEQIKIIKLKSDGTITALASGEALVEIEVVDTPLKVTVPVRVKIPASINLSHKKLTLWTGQVSQKVWAEVRSEKDAFIEGYLPTWHSDDPGIVKVENFVDANRRQSWVKMTAVGSGDVEVTAVFKHLSKSLTVSVFDEDEGRTMDGRRIKLPKQPK